MTWNNYWSKVKKYFSFNRFEIRAFFLTTFILAFIWSFDKWGVKTFDFKAGLFNYVIALLLIGSALFVHHAGQKLWGLRKGFRVQQRLWWYGLIFSLLLVFLTDGKVKFLAASGIFMLKGHRLGAFRYGTNIRTYAAICLAGPIANILFGTFFKQLVIIGLLPASIGNPIFTVNMLFAVWNLIPIPPLDGSRILYSSRLLFAFLFGAIAGYVILIQFNIYSYIFAALIGVLTWFLFLVFFEKD